MGFVRTALLLAIMTALFLGAGYLLGGPRGTAVAFFVALAMNAFTYWNSDKMVLRLHGARVVDARSAPALFAMVKKLAQQANLPMPRVYIMEQSQPNAFATGRDPEHAAVAVTSGLMQALTAEEMAGVIAHELAHIKNRDTLTLTLTATLAGALSMLANFALFFGGRRNPLAALALAIIAPLAAMIVQMAVSRNREYAADHLGGQICGNPIWLAAALHKINQLARRHISPSAERNPATAHLFIINPLSGQGADSLFSTHPSVRNRIETLEALGREMGVTGREVWQ